MRALTIIIAVLITHPLWAAPSGGYSAATPASGEITAAAGLIDAGRYEEAIAALTQILDRRPRNADALNLMGYVSRKSGDLSTARAFYTRALLVNPRHEGALSYMGELELQVGDIPAARALKMQLEAVCPTGCDALTDLNTAFLTAGLSVSG